MSQTVAVLACCLAAVLSTNLAAAVECPAREKCSCTSTTGGGQIACSGLTRADWLALANTREPVWTGLQVTDSPQLGPALDLADLSPGWRVGIASLEIRACDLRLLNASGGVRLPRLQSLDLSGNLFVDLSSALDQLAAGESPPPLRNLRLRGNHFSELGASDALARFRLLKLLDFSDCRLLRAVTFGFADSLGELRALRDLRFNGCARLEDWAWGPALRLLGGGIGVRGTTSWNCTCDAAWLASLPGSQSAADGPRCHRPASLSGRPLAGVNFTAELDCRVATFGNFSAKARYALGDTARLLCPVASAAAAAAPPAWVTWTTNRGDNVTLKPALKHLYVTPADTLTNTFHSDHQWHWDSQYDYSQSHEGVASSRIQVLQDGSLYIDYVTRSDAGVYRCTLDNGFGTGPVYRELVFTLRYEVLREVKKYGIIVGTACAASLLGIGIIIGLIRLVVRKCSEEERRKQKSIKEMLEHLESYRGAKMEQFKECKDWLKSYGSNQVDSYNARLGKVKEICINNMAHMQESYNRRIAKIRDHCDCQVERLRESYSAQMSKIKDYKSSQVERVRDQYNQQLVRIKEYAANQLERLREQYRAQQAHLIRVLESVSLDNCVSGSVEELGLRDLGNPEDLVERLSDTVEADDPLEDFVKISDGESGASDDDEGGVPGHGRTLVRVQVLPHPRPDVGSSLLDDASGDECEALG